MAQPQGQLTSFTSYELYAAFLMAELPRLSAVAIDAPKLGRFGTLEYAIGYAGNRNGLNLEFGVFKGDSLRLCGKRWPEKKFYGFDSFSGFPEDGRSDWNQDFSVAQIPEVPENCEIVHGYFEDTVDGFLKEHGGPVNFVNIDCDIFSSTRTILSQLAKYDKLAAGVVLHFDELVNYDEYLWNEMLALFESLLKNDLSVQWLFCHRYVHTLDETLRHLLKGTYPSWSENKAAGYRQQATAILSDAPLDYSNLRLPQIARRAAELGGYLKKLTEKRFPEKAEVFEELDRMVPSTGVDKKHLSYSAISGYVRKSGKARFELSGKEIEFDLENKHERAYAAKMLLNMRYPQSDIDDKVFRRFVRSGDRILDAGANIGMTALELLSCGADHVLCLEPVGGLFQRLKTLEDDDLTAIHCAVSATDGSTEIFLSQRHNQGSTIDPNTVEYLPEVFGEKVESERVDTMTIDTLVENHGRFDIWKLDVEGAEISALRGAKQSLLSNPPRLIFVELWDKNFDEFNSLVSQSHPYCYRARIIKKTWKLELRNNASPAVNAYAKTSPEYVFSTEKI